ncbi:MAG: diacylglycerol kinase family protein, partial [Myxococcota bacterium]
HTPDDADGIIKQLMAEGVDVLFAGGGDGTLLQTIRAMRRHRPAHSRMPYLGLLPLGTGNALASHFDLGTALSQLTLAVHGAPAQVHHLRLLEVDGEHTPFAGVGVEAMIINDYNQLKGWAQRNHLGRWLTGLPGYLGATMLRTLPRWLFQQRPQATIVNTSNRPAKRVALDGQCLGVVEPGEVIYAGPLTTAAASTTHCYGFNMRVFPLADWEPDRFQLRIYTGNGIDPLLKVPRLFDGSYTSPELFDVLADRVTIHLDKEAPLQVAGDAHGWKQSVTLALSPDVVPVWTPDTTQLH